MNFCNVICCQGWTWESSGTHSSWYPEQFQDLLLHLSGTSEFVDWKINSSFQWFRKTDLLVVGKKCCCGLAGTSFSTQPSKTVEWIKLHLFMTSEQMCCQSCKWRLVTSNYGAEIFVTFYMELASWHPIKRKCHLRNFPMARNGWVCLQYWSRTNNLIWWCLVIRYRGVETSFNHKRGVHIFEINDPRFQILVFTQGPFEVGYINFWWIFVKDTSSMGGETMKITIL